MSTTINLNDKITITPAGGGLSKRILFYPGITVYMQS